MKVRHAQTGPFSERPVFELWEIENTCSDELRAVSLLPQVPEAIRIDRFIEKRFGLRPEYKDLDSGVLAYTKFGRNGPIELVLSQSLSEEGTAVSERRVRTTFAHEAGHMIFHRHLFALESDAARLFGGDANIKPTMILCRDNAVTGVKGVSSYGGQWWEYQANQAMGALLLPKGLVLQAIDGLLEECGLLKTKLLADTRRIEAERLLADTFDVNPIVARIRLDGICPKQKGQLTL